jgi:hypothetical protein
MNGEGETNWNNDQERLLEIGGRSRSTNGSKSLTVR